VHFTHLACLSNASQLAVLATLGESGLHFANSWIAPGSPSSPSWRWRGAPVLAPG